MTNDATFSPEAVAYADRLGELLTTMRSAEAELGALLVERARLANSGRNLDGSPIPALAPARVVPPTLAGRATR